MTRFAINKEFNGIEITFDSKPAAETLEALKASGYRWHRVKKVWYAKQNPERLALAQALTGEQIIETPAPKAAKADTINLDNLGETRPVSLYGAELAKSIREDLKRRGVKGVTVRARKVTWDTGITVTIKATSSDFASLEEMRERHDKRDFINALDRFGAYIGERWVYYKEYMAMSDEEQEETYNSYLINQATKASINTHYIVNNRNTYYEFTTAFYNKVVAVFKIANQWNWDHSDMMTDYFDIGYFLDIDIKVAEDFEIREKMTNEEREALQAERQAEEEEKAARLAQYEKEQEEARKAHEAAEKIRKEQRAIIEAETVAKDLELSEQIYITNLSGGWGKECNLDELNETLNGGHFATEDAVITRKVEMSVAAYNAFCELFLDDFEFLAGMGGTASEDLRLEEVESLYSLNEEQRASVKWFINNAVGIYVNGELKLVCDPQGHTYSRYTYIPTAESKQTSANDAAEQQRAESEEKPAFYFPAPVVDQAQNIKPGDSITIYQCDGWNLANIYAGAGTVASVSPGDYAQHKGIYITFTTGKRVHVRDGNACLIYSGIMPALPDSVTRRQISANMYECFNYGELFKNTLVYYEKAGRLPVLDTIQR